MPFNAYYFSPDKELKTGLDESEIKRIFAARQGLLWVDVNGTMKEDGNFLLRTFNFHPLAVEDSISPLIHPPKIDEFDDYIFMIVHGIDHSVETEIVETGELAVFLGENYIISVHNILLYSVEATKGKVEKDSSPMKRGADFLAHALLDALVDNILPTIDKMSDIADNIEEETIREPKKTTLETMLKLKRSTIQVHRVAGPQREIFNRISRGDFRFIKDEAKIFYRDVYDHLVRIEDLNQTIRDRIDNVLTTYLSAVANRQNEVMKTLAVVATIMMPLTLLVGIYGMNFKYMPELDWEWGYFVVLGVIVITITVVLWRFWVGGWISRERRRVTRALNIVVDPRKIIGYTERIGRRRR